jgi:IS30 family transposase
MRMRFSAAEQAETWERFDAGESMRSIARSIGRSQAGVRDLIQKTGGIRPLAPTVWSDARMSLAEREEISRGLAAGLSMRQVAAGVGRAPSTISREVAANGSRHRYRACEAEASARRRARRPRSAKLARCSKLRGVVEGKLENATQSLALTQGQVRRSTLAFVWRGQPCWRHERSSSPATPPSW